MSCAQIEAGEEGSVTLSLVSTESFTEEGRASSQALALGADAVLLGRPVVYGLALGGQEGVERVLGILKREFKTSLALMGCPTVHHLNKDVVLQHGETYSRL